MGSAPLIGENDMNREITLTATKTYKTADNARAAVRNAGDEGIRHFIMRDEATGRYFPVFRPTEQEMAGTGVHFRWTVI